MKVEFAAIPPRQMLKVFQQRYHLALVQECAASPKRYASHYKVLGTRGEYVILDNGAYEKGKSVNIGNLLGWANHIKASEIVLPDILFEAEETIKLVAKALITMRYHEVQLDPSVKVMVVPQGRNYQEWFRCCDTLQKVCRVHQRNNFIIGIPKHTTKWAACGLGRLPLISFASQFAEVHLLGTDDSLQELMHLHSLPVRSVDSAKPIIYAMNDIALNRYAQPPTGEILHRPHKYFGYSPPQSVVDLARRNVNLVRMVLEHGFVNPVEEDTA